MKNEQYTYLLFRSVYYDIKNKIGENTRSNDYKRLLLYLIFCLIHSLSTDQIKGIISSSTTGTPATVTSLKVFLHREMKQGFIDSSSNAYNKKFSLYSLTEIGLDKLHQLLEVYHLKNNISTHYNSKSISKTYSSHRRDPISNHSIAANTVILSLMLSDYNIDNLFPIEREVMFTNDGTRQLINKKKKLNIVADLYFDYYSGNDRHAFIEVDMNTERNFGSSGLLEKLISYSNLSSSFTAVQKAPINVIFTISTNTPQLKSQNENYCDSERSILLSNTLPSMSYAASLIFSVLYEKYPDKNISVSDMINWLESRSNYYLSINRHRYHNNLLELLKIVANKLLPDGTILSEDFNKIKGNKYYGQYPGANILDGIKILSEDASTNEDDQLQSHNSQAINSVKKKKISLFNLINMHGYENGIMTSQDGKLGSLLHGMTLACCPQRFLNDYLPFILPEFFFAKHLTNILHNIGINEINNGSSELSSHPRCLPLRGHSYVNNNGINSSFYDTYMRSVFQYGSLSICIENISDDLGGFLRVKEYLRLSPTFRPHTLLIILINDELRIADGSSINECSIYFNENIPDSLAETTRSYINYGSHNIYDTFQFYIKNYNERNNIAAQDHNYLPFLTSFTQDFIMLTYSEFKKATYEYVCPWLLLPDGYKKMRIPLPPDRLNTIPMPGQNQMNGLPPVYW